ncbi:MAG: hypothetical protein DHS20C15_06960 [Planctomycetota bacterium]|nr:MAG: hypothetical protein DHS20C15_06960 [Planctomycetota bacterium]
MKAASIALLLLLGGLPVLAAMGGFLSEPSAAWEALTSARVLGLALRTLGIGVLVALFSSALGVPVARLLARAQGRTASTLSFLLPLPLILPPWVAGVAWLRALPLSGFSGTVFLLTASLWPLSALFALRGFRSAARAAEVAELLRGPRAALRRVELPLALPSILSGALLVFVFAITDFAVVDLLSFTSPEPFAVLASEVFQRWDKEQSTAGAAALTLLAALPAMLALWGVLRLERSQRGHARGQAPVRQRSERWGPASWAAALGLLLSLAVPVVVLVQWAWQLEEPASVLAAARPALFTSLGWALISGALVALLGVFVARRSLAASPREEALLMALVLLPLAVPGVSFAVGLLRVWGSPLNPLGDAVYTSPVLVLLAFLGRHLALGVLAARSLLLRDDPAPMQAAALVERPWLQRWWSLQRPMLMPALGLSFALGYLLAMRELDLVVLPRAGADSYSHYIFSMVHNGSDRVTALLCLALVALVLIPAGVARLMGVRGVDCSERDGS